MTNNYIYMDEEGKIQQVNTAAAKLLDIDQHMLADNFFENYIIKEDKDLFRLHLQTIFKNKDRQTCELKLKINQNILYAQLDSLLTVDNEGKAFCRTSIINLTSKKQTKKALQEAEERYRYLFNITPVSIWEIDFTLVKNWMEKLRRRGVKDIYHYLKSHPGKLKEIAQLIRVLDVNQATIDLLEADNKEQFLSKYLLTFTDKTYEVFLKALVAVWEEKELVESEISGTTLKGNRIDFILNWTIPTISDSDKPDFSRIILTLSDITRRKKAEDKLRHARDELQEVISAIPAYLWSCEVDEKGNFSYRYFSPMLEKITGRPLDFFWESPEKWFQILHPEDIPLIEKATQNLVKNRKDQEVVEYRLIKPEGTIRWVQDNVMAVRLENGKIYLNGVVSDITERKQAENELKKSRQELRELSVRLQKVQEEERKYLSKEIQNRLGQALTVLNMDLSWLKKRLPGNQEVLREKIRSMSELLQKTIQEMIEVSTKLRPAVLDDLGLISTIQWEIQKFQKRTGIECELFAPHKEININPDLSTNIFRVFQEILVNVERHAEATQVKIELKKEKNKLILKVSDNGKGISMTRMKDSKSLGFLEMRERLHPWGGQLQVSGKPSRGTTVSADVPLKENIKVLIADNHEVVRQGLKQILSETSDIVTTGEARDGYEVLYRVWKEDFDVLLLDLSIPGRSGLELLEQIKFEKPDLPVLVLSIHQEVEYVLRALKAGALGYLNKGVAHDELVKAIRMVAHGQKYIPSMLAEKIALEVTEKDKKLLHENLSNREFQVMCMIGCGKTLKEIANLLSLSVTTISTIRSRMLKKMKMKNNAEVIYYAVKQGLVK